MRIEIIPKLLKTLYEDKLSGKTSEDNYCVLSQEYSDEREQLQKKILKLRRKLTEMGEKENDREEFIHAIRKFMEMRTLTKQVLNELIDHIDVYETQGTGKNKTQRLVIYYKFVGYLDIDPTQCHPNYTADIREGVAIEYVSCEPSDSLKELFSEGYNADDDSFEQEEMEQAEKNMEQKIRRDRNMGDNLRRLRAGSGLSQEKLCAELQRRGCDIGRTTYAKYESGELNIRASVIVELRKIYSCSYDEFFAGLEDEE